MFRILFDGFDSNLRFDTVAAAQAYIDAGNCRGRFSYDIRIVRA